MPKETLVLKDFTTGLVGSEHGSDLPNNSIVEGGNINVNRNIGLIELAGRYKKALRADDVNNDGTSEQFTTPGNFIGFRGRGLFYFTSDYSDFITPGSTASYAYDSLFSPQFTGSGCYIGPTSVNDHSTEYYIYASRHENRSGFDSAPGYTSAVFHVYCNSKLTRLNLLGENLGFVGDGTFNGHVADFPMGNHGQSNYNNSSDPTYCKDWFPVYFYANGAVRICDGGFLEQNTAKVYLGYERDNVLFNGLTASADNTAIDTSAFRVDNWIFDKGGNTDKTEGMLYAPVTESIGVIGGSGTFGSIDQQILNEFDIANKVTCMTNTFDGNAYALSGESFPAFDFDGANSHGGLILDLEDDGAIACSLHVRSDGSQGAILSNANILLPQRIYDKKGWALYVSYVYDNNQESSLTEFTQIDQQTNADFFNNDPAEVLFGPNKRIDVYWQVNASKKKVHPRVKGAKLYIKTEQEQDIDGNGMGGLSSDYHLISEMSFELGARSPASPSFSEWYPARYIANSKSFICRNSFGTFSETFQTLHGYVPDDIKPCYYKTACVLHGKAYVGNVKFDGRLYPDRMMKSEVGEFDTFTKYGFVTISGTEDDGDSIVHLEGFGDRVLQFKNNIVYIINVSKQYDYVELSVKYAGINNPSQVVQTDKGVYWANRRGLWWYNGESVINLLESRGLTINNKSARLTGGELDDAIGTWEDIFLDDKDGAPVLSYDPINKDVVIMTQNKYEENKILDKVNAYLYSSQGDWTASGGSIGFSTNSLTSTVTSGDQGVQLAASKFPGVINGETYRVEATIKSDSGFDSEPVIRFKLGNVEADIEANDGNPARGAGITNTYQSYFADITPTDDTQPLIIFNDSSASTDDSGTFSIKNVSIRPVNTPSDDIAFLWNTNKNNLTQLFHRTSRFGKSNSIITSSGDTAYLSVGKNYHNDGQDDGGNEVHTESSSTIRVWHSSAQLDNVTENSDKRNLFLLTKAIDFDNHSRRKVIQSVHFTYKSHAENYMVPFIKAYYLDGTSPAIYYMCTSSANSLGLSDLKGASWNGRLPATSSKFETFKYRHVLDSGTTGSAVSMRSKVKNVGAIQIGLAKFNIANPISGAFSIEEIALTYRTKSAK